MLALALALAAQNCSFTCPRGLAPAPDAPSIEAGRRWMQNEIDLAERHNNDDAPGLVNATTSLTPEAEHVPTGAHCRFWFGLADIRFTFYNGRALSCGSMMGWLNVGATIYHREERPNSPQGWQGPESGSATATPRDVALARAAAVEREAPGLTSAAISETREWVTPGGQRIPYVAATVIYPGGAPDGTPQRRQTRLYAALVGDWMLIYRSDGPVHYRAAIDNYAEDGFRRLLASVEAAGRIMPPASPTHRGTTDR